ncbi:MAG TPA: sulfur carrier protein ThiS [Dehalococcoidia bacterium]|nr:sulfur carrier protein ThiS [Dehalococcoidia bacterium]
MITATINGKPATLEREMTVAAYVETLPVKQRFIAVAKNGEVVPREKWQEVTIAEGDVIEIVRMVGGG